MQGFLEIPNSDQIIISLNAIIRHELARSSAFTCILSHFLNIYECVDSFKFASGCCL